MCIIHLLDQQHILSLPTYSKKTLQAMFPTYNILDTYADLKQVKLFAKTFDDKKAILAIHHDKEYLLNLSF